MLSSSPRDNWERLVAAVLKRDQIWQLCHQDSITTATTSSHTHTPSNSSGEIVSMSSNRSNRISVSPPSQHPFTSGSGLEVGKNASGTITGKLFSALQRRMKPKDNHLNVIPEERVRRFSLRELKFATDNFHNKNILGRGSHGKVYKGRLADGSLVAIKRLTAELQGIETELEVTSIAAHRNVLCARGFCFVENERLLVFPFMAKGSVASQLRERPKSLPPLNWPVREQIAVGAAKGLAYLHYECLRKTIHRDVKASNILLDEDFEAVVADFNLAEFMDCYDGDVVTEIKGTIGHIAPEYLATGEYSVKADVFGYGVFLLELITAQKSYDLARATSDDDVVLLNRVKGSYKEGKWKMIVDAELRGEFVDEEVVKMLQIALICTQTDPKGRPTMLEVVRMLEVGYGLVERWEEWYNKDFKHEIMELGHLRRFTLEELQAATDDFSDKIISKDGFNMVYRGWFASSPVAVKRYNSQSLEDYFHKECRIGRFCLHPNLVHVIGFCSTREERLIVYRLMVNGSVESWLRGRHESRLPLTWHNRKKIALGAARGLAFLHDKCVTKIIHRDIKTANIFLDENLDAVVGDLKLARFMDRHEMSVTTAVRGTIGHIAPEYIATGVCSDKTDVYSYGVFLLELITGQSTFDLLKLFKNDEVMLIDWVKGRYKEGKWKMIVDAELRGEFVDEEVVKMLQIALICTQTDPKGRPTMLEVVRMLEVGYGLVERWEEWYNKDFKHEIMELGHLRRFTLEELQVATDDFSDKIISKDGFNMVYRGWFASSPVAVKRYNSQSLEDYFHKECRICRFCLHPNLVHVIGFCSTREERLIVYRLMVNGSVESWLRGRHESRPPLTWHNRKKIALGAARGLAFLHDKCVTKIIHRDIKAANIFLDENLDAVVGDLKLARFMDRHEMSVTTAIRGTIGHIAPEYIATGECSDKTDVYSYGVFLLELITGESAFDLLKLFKNDEVMLIDWVKRNYELRNWEGMVDEESGGDFMEAMVKHLVQIALLCTRNSPQERPRMSEVVWMLVVGEGSAERSEEEVNYDGYESDGTAAEELSGPR